MNNDQHIILNNEQNPNGIIKTVPTMTIKSNWLSEWDIESVPCVYQNNGEIKSTDYSILLATDTKEPIGKPFNPNTYSPISNKQLMELVEEVLDNSQSELVKVGSFRNRSRIYASIRIKDADRYSVGNRDFLDYLNFGNAFDQSSTLWANNSNLCIQCQNSFNYNRNECNTGIKIIHKGDIAKKIFNVKNLINNYLNSQVIFKNEFEKLSNFKISEKSVDSLFKGFISNDYEKPELTRIEADRVNRLNTLFLDGAGNKGSTLADAFSAITDFYTHNSVRKKDFGLQMMSSEIGISAKRKQDFWNIITNTEELENTIHNGEFKRAA